MEIQDAFADFYEESIAQPTDPNVLYALEHDLMSAGVLTPDEMMAMVTAVLSDDPTQQPVIYANLNPAAGRFISLDEDEQEDFRTKLTGFCRAYAFVARVMPWTDAELERLFLYGKLPLTELPTLGTDPMPLLSSPCSSASCA